jgi:hypothetical protein
VREALLHDNLKTASRALVATIKKVRDEAETNTWTIPYFLILRRAVLV